MAVYNSHGGHNEIVQGASGILNEVREDRKVNSAFIEYMRAAGNTVYDCTDNVGNTQATNLANIVMKCNAHEVKYDISWHLNSGGGKGVEVLIYDNRTKDIAAKVAAAISKALGIPNRGVKLRPELYVLRNTNALAMLIECCFVDSPEDAAKWNADKCAKAVAEVLTGKSITGGSTGSGGASKPSTGASSTSYYKAFNDTSIVDGLKSIGVDSGMPNRKKIAAANGISNYTGTAAQNNKLLSLARSGKLKKAGSTSSGGSSTSYYKAFTNTSIVDGLKSIGVDSGMPHRKKIAAANGISGYTGTAAQNNKLLSLAKSGKLKKA